MSETPAPYGPKRKPTNIERVAEFMNGFLGPELLFDYPWPKHLQGEFDNLDEDGKKELFEYTFHLVFKDAAYQAIGALGRDLSTVEFNLIKRRIVNFLKQSGIEYNGD